MEQYLELVTPELVMLLIAVISSLAMAMSMSVMMSHKKAQKMAAALPQDNAQGIAKMHSDLELLKSKQSEFERVMNVYQKQQAKTALNRFNPFRDSGVGGNQSFSLAHVDSNGYGFVITHLFSREMSRVTAKEVVDWKCADQELLPEEITALEQSKNN